MVANHEYSFVLPLMRLSHYLPAVDIVLNKRPITIEDTELKVDEYEPFPQIPLLNTIRVTGLPPQVDLDFLQFYFKNTAKSGGDESANVSYNDGETFARVTFETEDGMYLNFQTVTVKPFLQNTRVAK